MKPPSNQKCEICKKDVSYFLIDGRIRGGEHGPKGHWMFMCLLCHAIHGLGYGTEDIVIYEFTFGRYFEVQKEIFMNEDEIRLIRDQYVAKAQMSDEPTVFLLGEIAIQLALMNKNLEINNDLMRAFINPPQPPPPLPPQTDTTFDEGMDV